MIGGNLSVSLVGSRQLLVELKLEKEFNFSGVGADFKWMVKQGRNSRIILLF